MKLNVLIVAGGTGGHIYPALALAQELQARGATIEWLGVTGKMECEIIPPLGFKLHQVELSGVTGKSIKQKISALYLSFIAGLKLIKLIKQQKIDLVITFGGYHSGAAGIAAKLAGAKLLLHEQNSSLGISNKILQQLAFQSFAAFPNVLTTKKSQVIGQLLRAQFYQLDRKLLLERFKRLDDPNYVINLLVMGGSLGAQILNQTVPQALALLAPQLKLKVVHQTGKGKLESTQQNYQQLDNIQEANKSIDYQLCEYIDDPLTAYYQADFIICRSGAISVFELATAIVPAIFIPFVHSDQQQLKNANYLVHQDAAQLIEQSQLTPEKLSKAIINFNRDTILKIASNMESIAQHNAVQLMADYISQLNNHTNDQFK